MLTLQSLSMHHLGRSFVVSVLTPPVQAEEPFPIRISAFEMRMGNGSDLASPCALQMTTGCFCLCSASMTIWFRCRWSCTRAGEVNAIHWFSDTLQSDHSGTSPGSAAACLPKKKPGSCPSRKRQRNSARSFVAIGPSAWMGGIGARVSGGEFWVAIPLVSPHAKPSALV
ncbi:hypothetical protein Krac_3808 [Ktedonobacter racemifer DSM 44963]|uniref:Uncharacterized protein n=1 Tax=Ktedonobacter racemifer DSM 44963 TaxID=485913 RepID=D6U312_KTERA|nr:hypothetical protein Krac_3808 [Ktedonobacter racemifer DSM 44963]